MRVSLKPAVYLIERHRFLVSPQPAACQPVRAVWWALPRGAALLLLRGMFL